MIVSLEWLKDYTDVNVDTQQFCDGMILSGSNLETCELAGEGMEKVVVGKIEKIEKHPSADKLVVCQLNVGAEELVQIVTGAPNVFEGAYVPVALDGSRIPGPLHGQPKKEGGVEIHAGELRGSGKPEGRYLDPGWRIPSGYGFCTGTGTEGCDYRL